jgi:hypothetical protein
MRGIQYAAASRLYHWRLWNTGSPACAGDDGRECGVLAFIRHTFAIPRRDSPGLCLYLRALSNQRARGMPDARCTRGLVCKLAQRNAHEHTGSAEAIRHSLRNGFTAYNALSPATNSFCHRHRRINGFAGPGWAKKTSADLAPATGARTTRLRRPLQRRSSSAPSLRSRVQRTRPATTIAPDAAASTASHPAYVTIMIRPSFGPGRRQL